MRISGTEPSSVILSQKSRLKSWNMYAQKCQKQCNAKIDCVINPQNYNLKEF